MANGFLFKLRRGLDLPGKICLHPNRLTSIDVIYLMNHFITDIMEGFLFRPTPSYKTVILLIFEIGSFCILNNFRQHTTIQKKLKLPTYPSVVKQK